MINAPIHDTCNLVLLGRIDEVPSGHHVFQFDHSSRTEILLTPILNSPSTTQQDAMPRARSLGARTRMAAFPSEGSWSKNVAAGCSWPIPPGYLTNTSIPQGKRVERDTTQDTTRFACIATWLAARTARRGHCPRPENSFIYIDALELVALPKPKASTISENGKLLENYWKTTER